jgi:tRNA U34 2-thiouridine synthase MnmA/TrmU
MFFFFFFFILENYIEPLPGLIIDVDTRSVLGEHKGHYFYTIGQCMRLKNFTNKSVFDVVIP